VVRFVENSLSINQLNISPVDTPCVLNNDVGEARRSTQPVTLYISVTVLAHIAALNPPKSPPSIPTEGDHPPAKESTIPELIQFTAAETPSSLPHRHSIENDTPMSPSREDISPTEDLLLARHRAHEAHEAIKAIVPIDRSKMWESAVERVDWVMNTLSPIAEVRTMPFWLSST